MQSASPSSWSRSSRWSPSRPAAATCPRQDTVRVPGAEEQVADCLDDLTTKGTATNGHTDQSRLGRRCTRARAATRHGGARPAGRRLLPRHVDEQHHRGWMHDAQFVIRLPNRWNGKLVITGAPGVRRQFATDYVIGDFALARGYAYAPPTRATPAPASTATAPSPATRSPSGTAASPSSRAPPRRSSRSRYGRAPRPHLHDRHLQRRLPRRAGSSRTAPSSTTAASTGRAR